VLNILSVRNIF